MEIICGNFLNSIYKEFKIAPEFRKCLYYFKSGPNKNTSCQEKALENGYCAGHASYGSSTGTSETAATTKKSSTTCKAKAEIEEWLKTAVPQIITKLRRHSNFLLEESTDFVFNDDFIVFGKLHKDQVIKITKTDVKWCEEKGWKYDPSEVDEESE